MLQFGPAPPAADNRCMLDSVARLWRDPDFRHGARDMLGTALGIGAWGLVTGVAMVKVGLPVSLAVLMSLLVFAGSAQLAAMPLIVGVARGAAPSGSRRAHLRVRSSWPR